MVSPKQIIILSIIGGIMLSARFTSLIKEYPPLLFKSNTRFSETNISRNEEYKPEKSGKININTANVIQLQSLPGIGPVLSRKIVEFRTKREFTNPRDLLLVHGIGEKKYSKFEQRIVVETNNEKRD